MLLDEGLCAGDSVSK